MGVVEGDGLAGGDLAAPAAIRRAVAVATVASFDTWPAFSETEASARRVAEARVAELEAMLRR